MKSSSIGAIPAGLALVVIRSESGEMRKLEEAFAVIRQNAEEWGVCLSSPLSAKAAAQIKASFEDSFGVSFPLDYDRLLTFSNGFEAQRGTLFDGAAIQTWNDEHWRRTPSFRQTPGGIVYESFPNPDLRPIEYIWIGSFGNMDMYSYQLANESYRVTNLYFEYVYGEFSHLHDFLMYLADPEVELASST